MSQRYYVRRNGDEPFEAGELKRLVRGDGELRWGRGGIEWRSRDPGYALEDKDDPALPDAVFQAGEELSCALPCEPAIGKLAQIARRLDAGLFHEIEPEEEISESWLDAYPPGLEAEAERSRAPEGLPGARSRTPRAYDPSGSFEVGERIAHEKFGVGKVIDAGSTRIVVDFGGAVKKLAQRMA